MYFVFNKSHMFVRLNLVANLMYIIYVNNTLPLATDLYMKLHTELGSLWYFSKSETPAACIELYICCMYSTCRKIDKRT